MALSDGFGSSDPLTGGYDYDGIAGFNSTRQPDVSRGAVLAAVPRNVGQVSIQNASELNADFV